MKDNVVSFFDALRIINNRLMLSKREQSIVNRVKSIQDPYFKYVDVNYYRQFAKQETFEPNFYRGFTSRLPRLVYDSTTKK